MNCPLCGAELRRWKKARGSRGRSHSLSSHCVDLYICPVGEQESVLIEHEDGTCERNMVAGAIHGNQGERIYNKEEIL